MTEAIITVIGAVVFALGVGIGIGVVVLALRAALERRT